MAENYCLHCGASVNQQAVAGLLKLNMFFLQARFECCRCGLWSEIFEIVLGFRLEELAKQYS